MPRYVLDGEGEHTSTMCALSVGSLLVEITYPCVSHGRKQPIKILWLLRRGEFRESFSRTSLSRIRDRGGWGIKIHTAN